MHVHTVRVALIDLNITVAFMQCILIFAWYIVILFLVVGCFSVASVIAFLVLGEEWPCAW